MKTCTKCLVVKPLDEFTLNRSRKDGLASQCRECRRVYRDENREEVAAYNREYRAEHPEDEAARKGGWEVANPERRREHSVKGDARKRGATVLDDVRIAALAAKDNGHCAWCATALNPDLSAWRWDHILPISDGGQHVLDNCQRLHPSCHVEKTAMERRRAVQPIAA